MDYAQRMNAAFEDELQKISACATPGKKIRSGGEGRGLALGKGKGPMYLKLRQGRRPIRADKLVKKASKTKATEKALGRYGRAVGLGAGLGVLGMGTVPGEVKKYKMGREYHKQQRRAVRQQRAAMRRQR